MDNPESRILEYEDEGHHSLDLVDSLVISLLNSRLKGWSHPSQLFEALVYLQYYERSPSDVHNS